MKEIIEFNNLVKEIINEEFYDNLKNDEWIEKINEVEKPKKVVKKNEQKD